MTNDRPTAEALRATILRDWVEPRAQACFALFPEAESVLFAVAQYWSDEADDAVHGELVAFTIPDPKWPDDLARREVVVLTDDASDEVDDLEGGGFDAVGDQWTVWQRVDEHLEDAGNATGFLDDNGEMIVAFAAFCAEGASQEDAVRDAYTPYGIVRRRDGGVVTEVVGAMLRPAWDGRWDVVDAAANAEAIAYADAPPARTPSAVPTTSTAPSTRAIVIGVAVVLAALLLLRAVFSTVVFAP